ncbi:hypothetical protein [Azospirillum sp. SYSU D00513]|uniref:hypothetical protein n=1 Tax=Azospirillum sp. SYSU D00513 TaxID=2812561 RepID=UPI001A960A4F|nr:hypothetical protein [Azospirillum sp. SYSU D00513]
MRPSLLSVALLGTVLTGCAEPAIQAQPVLSIVDESADTVPVTYANRVGWLSASRGGAAVRGEGYEHVLAVNPDTTARPVRQAVAPSSRATPNLDIDEILSTVQRIESQAMGGSSAGPVLGQAVPPVSGPKPVNLRAGFQSAAVSKASASSPDQAWKRFCAGGKGMTADDWTVVMNTSGPPYHTLEEKRRLGCATLRSDYLSPRE